MTMATLRRKHLIGAGLQFRGLVHYHHDRKHGSVQAGMVLEKELRVLYLVLKQEKTDSSSLGRGSEPTPTVTHFLQQGHTYSHKDIHPNSVTYHGSMGWAGLSLSKPPQQGQRFQDESHCFCECPPIANNAASAPVVQVGTLSTAGNITWLTAG